MKILTYIIKNISISLPIVIMLSIAMVFSHLEKKKQKAFIDSLDLKKKVIFNNGFIGTILKINKNSVIVQCGTQEMELLLTAIKGII